MKWAGHVEDDEVGGACGGRSGQGMWRMKWVGHMEDERSRAYG